MLRDAVLSPVGHLNGTAILRSSWSTPRLLTQGQASGMGVGKRVVFIYTELFLIDLHPIQKMLYTKATFKNYLSESF